MPHFFNRRLRPFCELAFIKGSELRNNLFYGTIPLLWHYLPIELISHLALFICAIRIWHSERVYGEQTSRIAGELFTCYYRDHGLFYDGCQNFVLHIHLHLEQQYENFGALAFTSTFAQEDLIGHVSTNHHGSQYHGDLIAYYYSIDFALRNQIAPSYDEKNCLFDECKDFDISQLADIEFEHSLLCNSKCGTDCLKIFRRCQIGRKIYHSLLYQRCKKSVSYFITYGSVDEEKFGRIALFFSCRNEQNLFALIHRHHRHSMFSNEFISSKYHPLLKDPIDKYFSRLRQESYPPLECVSINSIKTHLIVFQFPHSIIVTPVSDYLEHD